MNNFEKLKEELASLYLDENLTDTELENIANRLIKFFAIGAKAVQTAKKAETKLLTSTSDNQKSQKTTLIKEVKNNE